MSEKPSSREGQSDPWGNYGQRMRRVRERAGLTLREAALRVGVNKNTLLRLERGERLRKQTLVKICAGYGVLFLDPEAIPNREEGVHYALHLPEGEQWLRTRVNDLDGPSRVTRPRGIELADQRRAMGRHGFADQFLMILGCDRTHGQLRAALFEVFGQSGRSRQASGEALVYAVKGDVQFHIGTESFVLRQGSAATFDRTVEHWHHPAESMAEEDLPAVFLYVQVD